MIAQAVAGATMSGKNDDVAKILKGLKLDRAFFQERVRTDPGKESGEDFKTPKRRRNKESLLDDKNRDFDIYLSEALMPLLAQALDALSRYMNSQRERGENLDKRVLKRFNPLTWLAQYLLRSHPKYLTTPRRAGIYSGFSLWADCERGRRELLRRRKEIQTVFSGFQMKNRVSENDLPQVISAVDQKFWLKGQLASHPILNRDLRGQIDNTGAQSCTFEAFWTWFSGVCMANDLVKYSAFEEGFKLQAQDAQHRKELEERRKEREEEERRHEQEIHTFLEDYSFLRDECLLDESLNQILHEDYTLTGDTPPNGEEAYEEEVCPHGAHVVLLKKVLKMLSFQEKQKTEEEALKEAEEKSKMNEERHDSKGRKSSKDAPPEEPEEEKIDPALFWNDHAADSWKVLQEMFGFELADGVVDKAGLEAVLVAPKAFLQLRGRVEDELEQRRFQEYLEGEKKKPKSELDVHGSEEDDIDIEQIANKTFNREMFNRVLDDAPKEEVVAAKPSMEELCRIHHTTMARMYWLHKQFEGFLQPPRACGYPEDPAALSKKDLQDLMAEVRPAMTLAEFDQKFRVIDSDGSGEVEFDEFVKWLREDELELDADETEKKPTFAELAKRFKVHEERILALHEQFQQMLPAGTIDGYPEEPKALSRDAIRQLLQSVAPDISDDEFDEQFALIDMDRSEQIEFDEFLEFLDFDEIHAGDE